MKKLVCLTLSVLMISVFIVPAFAQTIGYVNYVLKDGVNGKVDTIAGEKENDYRYAENQIQALSRTVSSEKPVVVRAKKATNSASASEAKEFSSLTTKKLYYFDNYGYRGYDYFLRMQNTTGDVPVTVTGRFTP